MFAKSPWLAAIAHGQTDQEVSLQDVVAAIEAFGARGHVDQEMSVQNLIYAVQEALDAKRQTELYLSEADLAKRWLISEKTLQRWRTLGQNIKYQKFGRHVRYLLTDVIEFEARAKYVSTSEKA
jgi:hypothetical protein